MSEVMETWTIADVIYDDPDDEGNVSLHFAVRGSEQQEFSISITAPAGVEGDLAPRALRVVAADIENQIRQANEEDSDFPKPH
jgi:hypothetical protein